MRKDSSEKPARFRELMTEPRARWLLAASVLFPASVLLFYYTQNSTYVPLEYVLLISGLCAILSALFWFAALWALKNPLTASLLCLMLWGVVFVESLRHESIIKIFHSVSVYYVLFVALTFSIVYLIRKWKVSSPFSFLLCAFITVFFLISAVNAAVSSVTQLKADMASVKTDFVVDAELADPPNVYWIHCDGMLSFDAVEKYFGDSQDAFREELSKRNFLINGSAALEACQNTTVAIPALMCPDFYDTTLSEILADRKRACDEVFTDEFQAILMDARLHNETINAFVSAGYETNTVALMDQYFFPTTDSFYFPMDSEGTGHFTNDIFYRYPYRLAKMDQLSEKDAMKSIRLSEVGDFMQSFFRPAAPLFGYSEANSKKPFASYLPVAEEPDPVLSEEELREILIGTDASVSHAYFVNALARILNEAPDDRPQFNVLMNLMFHYPYVFDDNGIYPQSVTVDDPRDYYRQHLYFSKVLIHIIDMILLKDPDAVIVLQADHGLNAFLGPELDRAFAGDGYSPTDLRNWVMSAIRVPQAYRNGEEKYAVQSPLNMARYIVNRFVGENYEYVGLD